MSDQIETRYLLSPDQMPGASPDEDLVDPMSEGFDSAGNEHVARRLPPIGRSSAPPPPQAPQAPQAPPAPVWQQEQQESLDNVIEEAQAESSLLDEAERRFELASYYKTILHDPLFAGQNSEAAQIVEAEIREFTKGRLQELLGMSSQKKTEKSGGEFSDEQLHRLTALCDPQVFDVLQALLAKLTGKPSLFASSAQSTPAPISRSGPPKVTARQAPNPAPPPKRMTQQQIRQPPAAKRPNVTLPRPKASEPQKGVSHPYVPSANAPPIEIKTGDKVELNQPFIDPLDKKVKKYVVNDQGETVVRDMTRPVKPKHMQAMAIPSPEQWNMISQHQADTVSGKQDNLIKGAILMSIGPPEE